MITQENSFSIGLKSLQEIGNAFNFINKLEYAEDRFELIEETKTKITFEKSYDKNHKTLNQWFLELKDLLNFDYTNASGYDEYADENVEGYRLKLDADDFEYKIIITPEYWTCNK